MEMAMATDQKYAKYVNINVMNTLLTSLIHHTTARTVGFIYGLNFCNQYFSMQINTNGYLPLGQRTEQ